MLDFIFNGFSKQLYDLSYLGEGAILKAILSLEDLHLIQYLDCILEFQTSLIKR